jgi:hypothetical protein
VAYNYQVNETAFFKLKKFFEYEDISTLPLEESVIENHFTRLDLDLVFESTPLSERLIERLHYKVSLDHVLNCQVVGTNFLHDHVHKFAEKEWGIIARRQRLSPSFIIKYLRHLDFGELVEKQILTLPVYEQAEKLGICIDWDNVVMCQKLDLNVIEKYWDKWDKVVQDLVVEHQQLNPAEVEFIIPKVSRNQCAILLSQQAFPTTPSITAIIIDYFSKWIYSKNYTAINILLETVAYKIDWTKLIYSNFCNHRFIYDEKIKNKILAELDRWGSDLIESNKPKMAKKIMRRRMFLEAKTHCCMSDFIYIDIL